MANPYEQFDRPPQAEKGKAANPYDDFDKPSYQESYTELARNTIAGANEGLAKVAGLPVDAATGAVNLGIRGVNRVAGYPVANELHGLPGSSESIMHGIGAIGGDNPETVVAQTPTERVFRAGAEGAGEMATGAGVLALGRKALTTVAPKVYSVMEGVLGKPTLETASIGAASGAGGQAAEEVAPEGYKTGAKMAGGLVGGGIPLAGRVLYEGGKFAVAAAKSAAQPFTKSGQEALAGTKIAGSASDLGAVKANLEGGSQEIVPGSHPTTFQQTGDMGLGQLERKVRTENSEAFIERASEQNKARGKAISGVQQTGSPADVATHFRGVRNAMDTATEASVNQARQTAAQHSAALGGAGNAEGHGELLRGMAQGARDTARQQERALWEAVDPDNHMVMPGAPIAAAARRAENQLSNSAKPIEGEERAIFDVARGYTDRTPFRDVMDLRSRVSTAMREELRSSGHTPIYGRLSVLRGQIEHTIDNAVENQARIDQRAVERGQAHQDDTWSARMRQEVNDFIARRNADVANGGGGTGTAPAGRPAPVPGASGAEGSPGGQAGLPPGNPGVQGEPIDAAAADRLRAASTATRERTQTFDEGATGTALRPGARAGEYKTPDSLVPSKIFHPGANGGEDVRSYVEAVGAAQAHPAIADYAAFSLRKAAARPDGTIDTAKALAWAKQHDAALAELPASVRSRLANPGRADEAVTAAVAERKQRMDAFDHSEIAKVMAIDSSDVVRQVGSVFSSRDAVSRMQQLATAAEGNPAAKAGLRRAVVEHIRNQFLSNAEAGTTGASTIKSDAFQTFMRTKSDVLAHVFEPQEIGALRAVATDLQRANRTINATKLAGGSNTAQDTAHRAAAEGTILHGMVVDAAIGVGTHAATNSTGLGVAAWILRKLYSARRDAGATNIDDLVKEAMLNPELARSLLQKVKAPKVSVQGSIDRVLENNPSVNAATERIARALKQIAVVGPAIGATQSNDKQH